jgi:formamidopyrimidine-DNA glycosylase
MPELPDITVYVEALEKRVLRQKLETVRIRSPFLLRTFEPALDQVFGKTVGEVKRLGKRIALGFHDELWLVLHLMIAGRLHWHARPPKLSKRVIGGFDFSTGSLSLTEAGSKRRASLHVIHGEQELSSLDAGGLEVMDTDLAAFHSVLTAQNHTLKRALTDPHIFSGIGNAYSDEILHRAKLSPIALTSKLTPSQVETLFEATRLTLQGWTTRLIREAHEKFPEGVTAFREGMAVHGRYGQPCPRCGAKVQRIRYADNETNYCPACQTGGRLLADRALSRLLREDWPRTLDELEALRQA